MAGRPWEVWAQGGKTPIALTMSHVMRMPFLYWQSLSMPLVAHASMVALDVCSVLWPSAVNLVMDLHLACWCCIDDDRMT